MRATFVTTLAIRLFACLAFLFASALPGLAQSAADYPLGPIGGSFRVTDGSNLLRITALTAGAPGITAGLQVGDYIYGAFGQSFSATGSYHYGACQDLGFAVDRAEAGDGTLPLLVMRGGTGGMTVNVALPAAGAFGVAYPRNSAKHAAAHDSAVAYLHSRAMSANGNLGYLTGWTGLALLGHSNWNDTTGAKPYRLSINKIRDHIVSQINGWPYAPVENLLLDGTANPNSAGGASNWELGQKVMFLAEYYAKTTDATVAAPLQRGTEMCGNSVQWWKQPAQHANGFSPEYDRVAGMSSHGGVTGDYMHQGWYCGINMTGVHAFNGMAFARRSGMDMTVRPRDGHYFGYDLHQGDTIPASIANALPTSITLPQYGADPVQGTTITNPFWYDPSVHQKFTMQLNFLARRSAWYSAGHNDDGMVGYAPESKTSYDAGGRSPGTLLGMAMFQQDVGGLDAADLNRMESLKGYITRRYMQHQEAHAFCVGAQAFQSMCAPYLSDRQQRFFMDNWRFFFALSRAPGNGFKYFPARTVADNYLNTTDCAAVNIALPYGIANGNYSLIPGYNTNRTLANFKSPFLIWPSLAARTVTVFTGSQDFQVDVCDGDGNVLTPESYTATWSHVSGPATATFSADNTANTTVTFPTVSGTPYRIRLTVERAGVPTLTEDIDITRANATTPVNNAIATHPTPQSTSPGGSATFTVGVTGSGPFLYQWRLNGVAYWGTSTSSTLNLTNVGSGWIGSYDCVVSTPTGMLVSNAAPLTIPGVLTRVPGALKREVWHSVSGTAVANLTGNANYPLFPAVTGKVTSAEAPQSYGDNYGQKLSGWLKPPASGSYRFFIASDDASELWLSTDDTAANKVKIATFAGATGYRSYSTGAQSILINLLAGQKYYIEILHKEGTGSDHLNVAWQVPGEGIPSNGVAPIEGAYLEYDDYLSTLAHHWKLDEESGTTCDDSAGTAPATLYNSPTRVAGILGNALSINTTTQYAQATVDVSETAYTASLWFRSTQASGGIFRVTGNSIPLDRLIMLRNGKVRAYLGVTLDSELLESTGTYNDGVWHHVVHTFGGSVGGQKLYVDGVLVDTGSKSSSTVTAQTGIRLGFSDTTTGVPAFIGQIDDVRTFDAPLLPQEVAAIFNETLNAAPQISPITFAVPENAPAGTIVGNVIATDPNDGQTITYTIDSGNFGGRFAIDPANGALTVVVPPDFETSGTYVLTITATDNGTPIQFAASSIIVNVTDVNEAPVFAGNPVIGPPCVPGTAYSGNLTAIDSDEGSSVSYSKLGGPPWLEVASDGTLSGTPAEGDLGINDFTVRATDNTLLSTDTTLRIHVVISPVWTNAAGGSWPVAGNWLSDSIADGQGIVADFSTLNLATSPVVTLDGARTLGGLKFGDTTPSHNWTLNTGSGGPLTLDVASGTSKITVNNQTTTINVALAGNDGLLKDGAGTLCLGATNTLTGPFAIQGGIVRQTVNSTFAAGTALTVTNAALEIRYGSYNVNWVDVTSVTLGGGATLRAATQYQADNGDIGFKNNITVIGTNTVHATGGNYGKHNWLSGGMTGDSAAYVNLTNGSGYGVYASGRAIILESAYGNWIGYQGTLRAANDVTLKGTVDLKNAKVIVDGTIGLYSDGSIGEFGELTGAGTLSANGKTGGEWKVGHLGTSTTYAGIIDGASKLTKTGGGTLTLTNASVHSGDTTVSAGTLRANNTLGSATGTGAVIVSTNGTLGGTGIISGATNVAGTLAPGSNAVGNLTINNTLTLAGGSKIAWEINNWTGAAGAGYDSATVTALDLTATNGNQITIRPVDLALVNFTDTNATFVLIQTTSGITGFSADKFTVDTSGLTLPHGTWAVQQSGNNLVLAYTANPDANGNGILDQWETTHFGNANHGANLPGDDADNDGLTNLMEYALNTDPLAPNAGTTVDLETIANTKHLRITVNKNPQATNLTYIVETCGALNDWSSANTVVETNNDNQLIVRDTFSTTTTARRFIRLRVSAQP